MGVEDNDLNDDHDIDRDINQVNEEDEEISLIEIMPSVEELVHGSLDLDIKYFPPILWKVGIGALGDNTYTEYSGLRYYDYGTCESELEARVKGIRSRYMNFEEFDEAINTYWEYMDHLIVKYGSAKMLKKFTKLGIVKDYIPKKPKLKNTKRNRDYFKYGVAPVQTVYDMKDRYNRPINPFDNDESRAQVARMFPVTQSDIDAMDERLSPNYVMTKEERAYYKKEAKWAKKAMTALNENPRKKSIYAKDTSSALDSIKAYFNNISSKKKDKNAGPVLSSYEHPPMNAEGKARYGDDYTGFEEMPLTEVLKYLEFEDEETLPDELRLRPKEMWERETYRHGVIVGRDKSIVKADAAEKAEVLRDMILEGFDVMGLYGKSLTKDARDVINDVKDNGRTILSKKAMRLYKKRQKKELKKMKENARIDKNIIDILLDNRDLSNLKRHIGEDGIISGFHVEDMPEGYE